MQVRKVILATIAALVVAAPLSSGAHFKAAECSGTVTVLPQAGPGGDGTLYVEDRSTGAAGEINHWVYMESNNHPGLQSGGGNDVHGLESTPAGDFADPCDSRHTGVTTQDMLLT